MAVLRMVFPSQLCFTPANDKNIVYIYPLQKQATNGNKKVTSLALCTRSDARSHVAEKQVARKLTEAN